jgi:hypothetical protein
VSDPSHLRFTAQLGINLLAVSRLVPWSICSLVGPWSIQICKVHSLCMDSPNDPWTDRLGIKPVEAIKVVKVELSVSFASMCLRKPRYPDCRRLMNIMYMPSLEVISLTNGWIPIDGMATERDPDRRFSPRNGSRSTGPWNPWNPTFGNTRRYAELPRFAPSSLKPVFSNT